MHHLTTKYDEAVTASASKDIVAENRGLLTKLADGEWLPSRPEEIVVALQLLAVEQRHTMAELTGADTHGTPKTTAARAAWA